MRYNIFPRSTYIPNNAYLLESRDREVTIKAVQVMVNHRHIYLCRVAVAPIDLYVWRITKINDMSDP